MRGVRALLLGASFASFALFAPGCAEVQLAERARQGLERALAVLVERQEPDGAWRSALYPALASGAELTPLVAKLLAHAPPTPERAEALRRARAFLAELPCEGLAYPVYTASLAALALRESEDERERAACARWIDFLRAQQLDERLGWREEDLAFGGFGYARVPLLRPPSGRGEPFDADLSSTLFALGALRLHGAGPDDPAVRAALRFVERCQNLPGDGGFFLTPSNPWQNKAGGERTDAGGRTRHASYGSATADGLRALLRCGLDREHERVRAARAWLVQRFDAGEQPGDFERGRASERRSGAFYWRWSAAHALFLAGAEQLDWAAALARTLLALQRADGSFANPSGALMEDEPLVATAFAAAALALATVELSADAARARTDEKGAASRVSEAAPLDPILVDTGSRASVPGCLTMASEGGGIASFGLERAPRLAARVRPSVERGELRSAP